VVPDTCPSDRLTTAQAATYTQLYNLIDSTLGSEPPCPGDGNLDKVVNLADVQNWFHFSTNGVPQPPLPPNTSSWYDFNKDGSTDEADLKIILMNFGKSCIPKK